MLLWLLISRMVSPPCCYITAPPPMNMVSDYMKHLGNCTLRPEQVCTVGCRVVWLESGEFEEMKGTNDEVQRRGAPEGTRVGVDGMFEDVSSSEVKVVSR